MRATSRWKEFEPRSTAAKVSAEASSGMVGGPEAWGGSVREAGV
jgi:hypothetical protein